MIAADIDRKKGLMLCRVCHASQMLVSNGVIELTFENDLERTMLSSIRDLATDITTELSADMVFYVGGRHPQQPPWCVALKR